MNSKRNKVQKGFSLIEVMLSVLILGIGILAVSKLQTSLIRSGANANQRSLAANLIQKKTDDLRRFVHLTTSGATVPDTWSSSITSPNSLAYEHIADNAGGLIGPATVTIGNIDYGLSWYVQDYYYSGTDAKATTMPFGADYPSYKAVHVVATWSSVGSVNNVVSFDTIIDAYGPTSTALGSNLSTGNDGPVIPYDPLQAPDVLPITIESDGLKKETSKPLPDLSKKGDSTLVKFETVTYAQSLDTVKREEFRTLVCNCKTGITNNEQIYGITTWDDTLEKIIDVTSTHTNSISRTVVDNSNGENQANECFICCRDGDVTTGASPTFKVCRMKRVDGILRLFEPWKMIGFNLIPASYFNDSDGLPSGSGMTTMIQTNNISTYSNYVTSLVRNVLKTTGSSGAYNSYTTVDTTFVTNTATFTNGAIDHKEFYQHISANDRPMQARAIYLDYPPSGIFTQITNQTTFYTADTVPLDRIPFFEVNMTELAGWIPDRDQDTFSTYTDDHDNISNAPGCNPASAPSYSYVTNDAIKNGCETSYSRGNFFPKVVGTTTVTTEIFTNSDGVIDRNINNGNTTINSSIGLKVNQPGTKIHNVNQGVIYGHAVKNNF